MWSALEYTGVARVEWSALEFLSYTYPVSRAPF